MPLHGNRTFIHFLPLNVKIKNQGDFLFFHFLKKLNWGLFFMFPFSVLNKKRSEHGPQLYTSLPIFYLTPCLHPGVSHSPLKVKLRAL